MLLPEQFLAVRRALEAFSAAGKFFAGRREGCPVLSKTASGIGKRTGLVRSLRRCIDDDARVADGASEELRRTRRALRRCEND